MDLLTILVERAGTVVSKKELIARVWPDMNVDESGLRFHIAALRKALKDGQNGNRYITNVPGRGYSFVAPVARSGNAELGTAAAAIGEVRRQELPSRLKRLIGRDEALREISTRLIEHRFVTITGAGGMGKTTVAISVAHELATTFEGSVCFVDFGEVDDPASVPNAIAVALGITTQACDPLRSLSSFVSDKRVLLLLDNCEHLIGVVAELAEGLFKGAPGLHILATSREALRAEGEQVYRLPPLVCPSPQLAVPGLEALTYPAVQLFVERAAASGAHITFGDVEARIISEICNWLDGMPLAICVAAGRVGAHGLTGMAHLLKHSSCWLHWQGPRTSLLRQQSLHAVLDRSCCLLTDNERLILFYLSVFDSVFTLEAACAVAADSKINEEAIVDVIYGLVAKSLVSTEIDGCAVTYRLLETTRAYALERLTQNSEADAITATARCGAYLSRILHKRGEQRIDFGLRRHKAQQTSRFENLRIVSG